jgi:AAA domain
VTDTHGKSKPAMTVHDMEQRLRLTPRLAKTIKMRRVTDAEARMELGFATVKGHPGDLSGIAFPGYDLHGKARGVYQVRRDNPEVVRGKEKNKWMSSKGKDGRYLNTTHGALKASDVVLIVESPKSTLALAAWAERVGRKNIKVIDTNGLDGYMVRDAADNATHPNPDLMLLAGHDVVHCPDSNATRPDLRAKVERFQAHLLDVVGVNSLRTGRLPKKVNGPDDLVALDNGDQEFESVFQGARSAWEEAFPAASDFANLELKADLLIPHIIANNSITILAAPSEGYKTVFAMQTCRALLTGESAFEYFPVEKKVKAAIYCCPDMSFELALKYARDIGLAKEGVNFHLRTMKQGELLGPGHALVKAAARDGCYLVLDTLNYFIKEDLNPQVLNEFATKLRYLIDECGSPGAMVLAHPTKAGVRSSEIEVTEWVSGTYSKIGVVDTIFCLKKMPLADDSKTPYAVYITREKSRPFLGARLDPFTIDAMKVSEGRFPVLLKPGAAPPARDLFPKKSRGGHPPDPQKDDKKRWLQAHLTEQKSAGAKQKPTSAAELARRLNSAFLSTHDSKTIRGWMKEISDEKKLISQISADDK